jgi:sialate O-acetylesterase
MKINRLLLYLFSLTLTIIISIRLGAELWGPSVISNNMVLQQNSEVSIWGWAKPDQVISFKASWGMEEIETRADGYGRWIFKVKTPPFGGPYTITIRGENKITLKNIMVGEVWVCSGQSNMLYPVYKEFIPFSTEKTKVLKVKNFRKEIKSANYPEIRMFTVQPDTASHLKLDCRGSWEICSPQTVPDFSAVGYFFGRKLHKELDVPIGLIHTSVGGSTAEAWIKREFLEKNPELNFVLKQFEETKKEYNKKLNEWKLNREVSKKNIPEPPKPKVLIRPQKVPSFVYNAMLNPIIPYTIKGVIWYQGEGNAHPGKARNYRDIFMALVKNWREEWGQGKLPFYFVQLPNFKDKQKEAVENSDWAIVREAQLVTLQSTPNTGMAITIDLGEEDNVHPDNKQDVGMRLALWALHNSYDRELVYSGPICESIEIENDRVRLDFNYVGEGLLALGDTLKGFAVAGADKKFHWADSRIINRNSVIVRSKKVPKPIAVRYGWADNPVCNLYNSEGLPASPFRTDKWDDIR